jgi:hypothetical protein
MTEKQIATLIKISKENKKQICDLAEVMISMNEQLIVMNSTILELKKMLSKEEGLFDEEAQQIAPTLDSSTLPKHIPIKTL